MKEQFAQQVFQTADKVVNNDVVRQVVSEVNEEAHRTVAFCSQLGTELHNFYTSKEFPYAVLLVLLALNYGATHRPQRQKQQEEGVNASPDAYLPVANDVWIDERVKGTIIFNAESVPPKEDLAALHFRK